MPLKTFGEFARNLVMKNVTAKLMALAMALVVWLYAYIFSYTEYTDVHIPVKVHPSEGWSVATKDHFEVSAKLRYPRRFEGRVEQALHEGQIYLDCNIAPKQAGTDAPDSQDVDVAFSTKQLIAPPSLSFQMTPFEPSSIRIEMVRETVESVRVIPKTSAAPPGYRSYTLPIPATVRIRGRKDIMAQLARTGIETEEIDVSSPPPTNQPEWDMPLLPGRIPSTVTFDGKSYPISCDDQVQVRIHLVRLSAERTFTALPIRLLQPQGYGNVAALVRESASDVQVSGPKSVVDALKPENVILYVDVGDPKMAPADTPYSQPVQAMIDRGIPGAGEVLVKPAVTTCPVRISEKPK